MLKYLICGATALGVFATMHSAQANSVIVNGQAYTGGNVTVPYGYGTSGAVNNGYCCGNIDLVDTGVVVSQTPSYAAPSYSTQTYSAPTYSTQTYSSPSYTSPTYTTTQPAITSSEVTYIDQPQQVMSYPQPTVQQIDIVPAAAATVAAPAAPYYQPAARPRAGWGSQVYVGARGGWTGLRDADFNSAGTNIKTKYDNAGWNASGIVGWRGRVHNGIGYRFETEVGYLNDDIDSLNNTPGNEIRGDMNVVYGFVNGYADVPLANRVQGVVGGGVGLGRVSFDGVSTEADGRVIDDADNTFGYHLDAGLSYDVNERLSLEALYRYMSFVDAKVRSVDGTRSSVDLDSHNVTVGARYGF